jgi:hypothetical protein
LIERKGLATKYLAKDRVIQNFDAFDRPAGSPDVSTFVGDVPDDPLLILFSLTRGKFPNFKIDREEDLYVLIKDIAEIDPTDRAELVLVGVSQLQALFCNSATRWAMKDPFHPEDVEADGPEQDLQHRLASEIPLLSQPGRIDVKEFFVRRHEEKLSQLRDRRMRSKPLEGAVQPFFVGTTHRPTRLGLLGRLLSGANAEGHVQGAEARRCRHQKDGAQSAENPEPAA